MKRKMKVKYRIIVLLLIGTIALSGCTQKTDSNSVSESSETEEAAIESNIDDILYIGEYLDSVVEEPNLEIAKGEDGNYLVQIGIYRLTLLTDGVGELTAEGLRFTATDAAGNPISGIITVEGKTATVTFTDSTWEYLENGSAFTYVKSSDTPNRLDE